MAPVIVTEQLNQLSLSSIIVACTVSVLLLFIKCLAINSGYIFITCIGVSYYTILCIQCILSCVLNY